MNAATLELLWARFLDGDDLDPSEEALLADALDDDPTLREHFLRDHDIETSLHWLPRTHLGQAAFAGNVMQKWCDLQTTSGATIARAESRSSTSRRWLLRWLPTALAAGFLVAAAGLFWNNNRREPLSAFATLAPIDDAKWVGSAPGARLAGDPMHLASGTTQMLLSSGAQVTAEGPADWQLLSGERLLALRGKFTAVVPRRAIGFTVQTPTAVVVDLGTEFEVSVDPDGATSVRVERGAVELATIPHTGTPSNRWRLGPGEQRRIDSYGKSDGPPALAAPQPKFHGAVAVDGQVREFDDESAFRDALRDARTAPAKKPTEAFVAAAAPKAPQPLPDAKPAQPLRGLDLAAREAELRKKESSPAPDDPPPPAKPKGVFLCNLRSVDFNDFDEFDDAYRDFTRESDAFAKQFEEIQKRVQRDLGQRMGVGFPNVFRQFGVVNVLLQGSIVWDDKRWEFNDRESLDRARQQLRRHLDATKAKPKAKSEPDSKPKATPEPKAKATPDPKPKPASEKAPARKPVASKNWKGINWRTKVADACKEAAGAPGPDDDKPVFVFRVLGDLNGFM